MRARSASGGAGEGREREGGRVSKCSWLARASERPPTLPFLRGESFYPPPARPRRLIGSRGPESCPLPLARVPASSVPTPGGGGGEEALTGSGPPLGPAPQSLARRPCATWQEARAGGGDRAGRSVCGSERRGGCKHVPYLSCGPETGLC